MKFVCMGHLDVESWQKRSEQDQTAMVDRCFAYDDVLRKNGHFAGGEGLQGPQTARTLRFRNGKVTVTDGPFAETKEFLGGLLFLEARDLNEAVELISKHPGVQMGAWEIRPVQDLTALIQESEARRRAALK